MKAVILTQHGGVENFAMQELPNPEVKEDEVLVRVRACSFNPADYQIRRGGPEANAVSSMVLGRDMAGVVEQVGRKVRLLREGDEVMAYASVMGSNGTNAEFISLPANVLGKKPANLSFEQAAAIPVVGLTRPADDQAVQA
ncbi:alcohol dehydrogenase-like protein [Pontibacter ummariensis]|uniref:Alcohol dehydrogenase GroES-like domain-containing protein n=1 Tax=Pontibacter ummariensis TaxID=1610492 RepID=A0A239LFI6_9BACT|nr:alcohol dehydrogenase catalytic domain-containing protein [Pontibacter ummariensis]PRY03659.1 alcohol dehydrogenase-like protein [Pontibacter ummariensis]SNT28284.1 Alcohol dehydrogenase GroES-like domain-containing protein [Pontibacter ummariensis]